MKTKTALTSLVFSLVILLCSTKMAMAENVFVKAPELNGSIHVAHNLTLTDWQAVMSCHFDYKGSRKESVRYPHTIVKKKVEGEYSLYIKKGSLSETLPGWRLLTCAYKMILIGRNADLNNRSILGEIYLLGQEHGEMDPEELKEMQNRDHVARILNEKVRDLKLVIAPEGGIVTE